MDPSISYKDIFLNNSDGLLATDALQRIRLINRQALQILGFEENEVINQPIIDVMPLTGQLVKKCLDDGKPQLGCHIHGNRRQLVVNVSVIYHHGKRIGTVVSFQEIQQFEDSAQQLKSYQRLNRQLNTIFHYSSDIIWLYDGEGRVININRSAEVNNNIKAGDVIGKSYTEVIAMGLFKKSIVPDVIKTKRQVSLLQTGVDGKSSWLNTGTPAFDDSGKIDFIVVNARDMTQLNSIKAELEENRLVTQRIKDELAEMKLLEATDTHIIAESPQMRNVLKMAIKLARMDVTNILLLGESGTGKGLLTQFIHNCSIRKNGPLIQINCAALPENLLEAELFGYENGAFTGARDEGKAGLFELADTGLLFLDEIGDMPLSIQAKLLKYLDDQEIMRLGGLSSRKVDCMVVAATNRDLAKLVREGRFREDLYFRISAFPIKLPPIRERSEDVFALIDHYLTKYNQKYQLDRKLAAESMIELQKYDFPGNVRELKNIIKKAVVLGDQEIMTLPFLESIGFKTPMRDLKVSEQKETTFPLDLEEKLQKLEKSLLAEASSKFRTIRKIAENLGTSKTSTLRKLKKYGIR